MGIILKEYWLKDSKCIHRRNNVLFSVQPNSYKLQHLLYHVIEIVGQHKHNRKSPIAIYHHTSKFNWLFTHLGSKLSPLYHLTYCLSSMPAKLNLFSLLKNTPAKFSSVQTTYSIAKGCLFFCSSCWWGLWRQKNVHESLLHINDAVLSTATFSCQIPRLPAVVSKRSLVAILWIARFCRGVVT